MDHGFLGQMYSYNTFLPCLDASKGTSNWPSTMSCFQTTCLSRPELLHRMVWVCTLYLTLKQTWKKLKLNSFMQVQKNHAHLWPLPGGGQSHPTLSGAWPHQHMDLRLPRHHQPQSCLGGRRQCPHITKQDQEQQRSWLTDFLHHGLIMDASPDLILDTEMWLGLTQYNSSQSHKCGASLTAQVQNRSLTHCPVNCLVKMCLNC